jgi:hypothetical protein
MPLFFVSALKGPRGKESLFISGRPQFLSQYRLTVSFRWPNVFFRNSRQSSELGSTGMCILAFCRKLVSILMERRYRPELHYMRGPGPKWIERHGR